jgi:hypothetical protein
MKASVLAVVIVSAVATISASQYAVAADPLAPATILHRVIPLDPSGNLRPNYHVAVTGTGYCWTSTFFNGLAYRCVKDDFIQDPCWKEANRNSVVCPGLPWSHQVTGSTSPVVYLPPMTRPVHCTD